MTNRATPLGLISREFGFSTLALYLPSWLTLWLLDGDAGLRDLLFPLPLYVFSACLTPCLAPIPVERSTIQSIATVIVLLVAAGLLWWLSFLAVRTGSRGVQILLPTTLAGVSFVLSPIVCWAIGMSRIQC